MIVHGYLVHVTTNEGRRTYAATSLTMVDSIAQHKLGRSIDTMNWMVPGEPMSTNHYVKPWTEGALPQTKDFVVGYPLHIYREV